MNRRDPKTRNKDPMFNLMTRAPINHKSKVQRDIHKNMFSFEFNKIQEYSGPVQDTHKVHPFTHDQYDVEN